MNQILGFLRIPLVRFILILVILYIALFSNKQNPDSLANRLSKEQLTKNLNEASEKSRFIISSVKTAQETAKPALKPSEAPVNLVIEDVEIGKEGEVISCGSEIEVTYGVYDAGSKLIKSVSSEKLIVGSNLDPIIEKNVISMKSGGIRNIRVPRNFQSEDWKLKEMLNFYDSDLRFQVSVTSVKPNANNKMICR